MEERKLKIWVTREEAAAHMRLTVSTLANYAAQGIGPPFWKPGGGRVEYCIPLIDEWRRRDPKDEYFPVGLQTGQPGEWLIDAWTNENLSRGLQKVIGRIGGDARAYKRDAKDDPEP
jgi:hypothetical protein